MGKPIDGALMASLLEVFDHIPDHRRAQAKQYPLPQVLLFCILGIMSGAVSYRKLHTFIRIRFALLSRAFPSRMRKPPSYTQLREILVGLNKDDLEAAFRQHAGALATPTGDAAIAADAKALRGSFDAVDDRNAALVLSLFVAGERIILAHRTVDEKSNEIPALQALIAELGLQGKLFTADAEHCQKKTFAQAQACGSQLLVQVKDNQPSLAAALAALPQTAAPLDVYETHDRIAHGRQENRRVEVFEAGPTLGLAEWEHYALVGLRVSRVTHHKIAATGLWTTSREVSWYITDRTVSRVLRGGDPRPLGRAEPEPLRPGRRPAGGCQPHPQEPGHHGAAQEFRSEHPAPQRHQKRRRRFVRECPRSAPDHHLCRGVVVRTEQPCVSSTTVA